LKAGGAGGAGGAGAAGAFPKAAPFFGTGIEGLNVGGGGGGGGVKLGVHVLADGLKENVFADGFNPGFLSKYIQQRSQYFFNSKWDNVVKI
jgi:hypothetical protein